MAEIPHDLSGTDASNVGRFPENQAPSTLNNGARALEGMIARFAKDSDYSVTATLSGSVIQMTANRTSLTLTGTTSNYLDNAVMAFTNGDSANPSPCSININGIGPISLRDASGVTLGASLIPAGAQCLVLKDGTNNYFRLLTPNIGHARPSFMAYLGSADLQNKTGNGTDYTIVFDTESYDVGSGFNTSTGVYTAPAAGYYELSAGVTIAIGDSGMTRGNVTIVTTDFIFRFWSGNPYVMRDSGNNNVSMATSVIAYLDKGDTAKVNIQIEGGGSDSADIRWGSGTILPTYFAGRLLR